MFFMMMMYLENGLISYPSLFADLMEYSRERCLSTGSPEQIVSDKARKKYVLIEMKTPGKFVFYFKFCTQTNAHTRKLTHRCTLAYIRTSYAKLAFTHAYAHTYPHLHKLMCKHTHIHIYAHIHTIPIHMRMYSHECIHTHMLIQTYSYRHMHTSIIWLFLLFFISCYGFLISINFLLFFLKKKWEKLQQFSPTFSPVFIIIILLLFIR